MGQPAEEFDGDFDQRHTLNVFVEQRLSYRLAVSGKLRLGSNFPIVGYFTGTPEALQLSASRNQVRLPFYSRLDVRANRAFTFQRSRLTLFVEVMNLLGRRNGGQSDGFIRPSTLEAIGYWRGCCREFRQPDSCSNSEEPRVIPPPEAGPPGVQVPASRGEARRSRRRSAS